jgi:hypothetical protein
MTGRNRRAGCSSVAVAILIGLPGLVAIAGYLVPDSHRQSIAPDADPPEMVATATQDVRRAVNSGFLAKWGCAATGNTASVREYRWFTVNEGEKETITRALAIACHAQNSGRSMTITAAESGRILATLNNGHFSVAP